MTTSAAAAAPATHAKAVQNPLTLIMTLANEQKAKELRATLEHIQSLPPDQNPVWVALDKLKIVHFARFVFLDNDSRLAVITTYDGSFEDYINDFVDNIGDVFNPILSHMKDAPPLPVQQNRQAFLDYVRAHDLRGMEPFYSAYPQSTVVDILASVDA